MRIWLVGPSGAGKSTVAPLLAEQLGVDAIDLDRLVEQIAGVSPFDLIAAQGEEAFRRIEWNALLELSDDPRPAVVALGGGAIVDPAARQLVAGTGLRIFLDLDAERALARLAGEEPRPLLFTDDPQATWRRLYRARHRHYAEADLRVDASAPPEELAREIATWIARQGEPLWRDERTIGGVRTVVSAWRSIPAILDRMRSSAGGADGILVDPAVLDLHGERLRAELSPRSAIIPAGRGEGGKSLAAVGEIAAALLDAGVDRGGRLLSLGGGVVTDLGGFVASVYMRGISSLLVPTTLLAQVDAAIGGKTALNAASTRNLLGTFRQPEEVLISSAWLRTLPQREVMGGFVEVVKMGIGNSAELGALAAGAASAVADGEQPANIDEIVRCAVRTKLDVVERDEFDQGARASLNLGHTFGHAIEGAFPGLASHGEAVAFGLIAAAEYAARDGTITVRRRDRIAEHALPFVPPILADIEIARVVEAMRGDKKRRNGHLHLVLPTEEVGTTLVVADDPAAIAEAIAATISRLT